MRTIVACKAAGAERQGMFAANVRRNGRGGLARDNHVERSWSRWACHGSAHGLSDEGSVQGRRVSPRATANGNGRPPISQLSSNRSVWRKRRPRPQPPPIPFSDCFPTFVSDGPRFCLRWRSVRADKKARLRPWSAEALRSPTETRKKRARKSASLREMLCHENFSGFR